MDKTYALGANVYPLKSSDPCGTASQPTNSRIRDGVTFIETQVGELHHTISMLEERLDTILVPTPPNASATGNGKVSDGPVSHMFDRMSGLNSQVAEAKARIHALLSRIEL